MNILLVSTQDYIHHPVPSRHHYIFEELATRHEVHVPHFHVSEGKKRETRLVVHEATQFNVKSPMLHYTLNAPCHYRVIDNIIRENDIDVVVAGHILAGTAVIRSAKKCGIPVIFDLKDWLPESAAAYYSFPPLKWSLRNGVWAITKYNLEHSDCITTVSPSLVDRLSERGFESKLITNGVDTDYFIPMNSESAKKRLDIPEDTFVIGFEGSIERFFDLHHIIEAMPEIIDFHPNTKLLIVGGALFTTYEQELKELVRKLGLNDYVIFTGTVPYNSLPEYIAAMDVCLIPYAAETWNNHALPNKFFEYSACGKPILSTPVPDVMKVEKGNYFVYRNMDEYVDKIRYFMDKKLSYDLDLTEYSWKKKAADFENLFYDLVK